MIMQSGMTQLLTPQIVRSWPCRESEQFRFWRGSSRQLSTARLTAGAISWLLRRRNAMKRDARSTISASPTPNGAVAPRAFRTAQGTWRGSSGSWSVRGLDRSKRSGAPPSLLERVYEQYSSKPNLLEVVLDDRSAVWTGLLGSG